MLSIDIALFWYWLKTQEISLLYLHAVKFGLVHVDISVSFILFSNKLKTYLGWSIALFHSVVSTWPSLKGIIWNNLPFSPICGFICKLHVRTLFTSSLRADVSNLRHDWSTEKWDVCTQAIHKQHDTQYIIYNYCFDLPGQI